MPRRPSASAETSASAPKSSKPKKKAAPRKKKSADSVVPAVEPLATSAAAASMPLSEPASDLDTPISYSVPEPEASSAQPEVEPATTETEHPIEDSSEHEAVVQEAVPEDIQPVEEHETAPVSESDEIPAIANTVGAAGAMSDIMPKASEQAPEPTPVMPPPSLINIPKTPVTSKADASFLQADNRSFGLKEHVEKKTSWVTRAAYILGALIILMILALVGITYFTNRALKNQNQNVTQQADQNAADNSQNNSGNTAVTPSTIKFAITGPSKDYVSALAKDIISKNPSFTQDTSAQTGLPKLTTDTLLYKSASKDTANALLSYLATLGIKPQLQENDAVVDDLVLYLTPTLAKPDLTGQVATVYNASGKTGAAKTICDALKQDLATSCSALNFTGTPPTGLQVYTKNQADYFILKRTPTFLNANFQTADSKQVEDIKVVIGK